MLRPWTTIDTAVTRTRLEGLQAIVRPEVETHSFDEAMLAAVERMAEASKVRDDALADLGARHGRSVRPI